MRRRADKLLLDRVAEPSYSGGLFFVANLNRKVSALKTGVLEAIGMYTGVSCKSALEF